MKNNLTQERLKELLNYEPETGVFTWRVGRGSAKKGEVAGNLHTKGYVHISVDGEVYKAHRLAWLYLHGSFPQNQIDHINGVRRDNRLSNLRCVSNAENGRNRKKQCTNTSGLNGVCFDKSSGKLMARIVVEGKRIYLGCFDNMLDAAVARKSAELKYDYHCNHGRS